jgi:hypothetical protein
MPYYLMSYHLSLFKNILEILRSISYHLVPCYFPPLKNNSKILRKPLLVISHFPIKKHFPKFK